MPRCGRLTARWKPSSGTSAEDVRERLLDPRVEPAPERQRAADDVLPQPALRLVERVRGAALRAACARGTGRAPLVEAVTALVHRREERVQVVSRVAGRQPDVAKPDRCGERMDGQIEPERIPGRAEALDQLPRKRLLRRRSRTARAGTPSSSSSARARPTSAVISGWSAAKMRGRPRSCPLLVVVEQDVVRIVVRREALDQPTLELEHPLERGTECLEARTPREPSPTPGTTRPARPRSRRRGRSERAASSPSGGGRHGRGTRRRHRGGGSRRTARASSSSSPIRSSIWRSWTIVSSVASCAPRVLSPEGGIQTSVSHARRSCVRSRSSISASRRLSSASEDSMGRRLSLYVRAKVLRPTSSNACPSQA